MSESEFSVLFLKRKLKNIPFQVWGYHHKNENYLIYDDGKNEPHTPPFHDLQCANTTFKIVKQNNRVVLNYFYPEEKQVSVCIFHHSIVLSNEEIEYLYYFIYLSQIKETIHNKDAELDNLVDSIRSVTSSLDHDEVLEKIIRNALKVIPAADAGYLLLYDHSTNRLIPKAPVGFNQNIYNFRVKVGESITGKVFKDGKGRIFNSKEELFEEMDLNKITKENYHSIISAGHTPVAAMCVPVSLDKKRIGVMIIHQWYKKKVLVEHDLKLLQGFAVQAAIAIQNAQFYLEANKRLVEITELSNQLKERNNQLQKRYEVHKTLTNISLQNKGIEKIIYEFNSMIKPSVSFFNVLESQFYSNNSKQTPLSIFEIKAIFTEKRQPLYVEINDHSNQNYFLYPIYNGIVFLGCLIINVVDTISKSDRMTIEQVGSVLSLEIVKRQSIMGIFYKKTHEQFEGLLNYRDSDHLIQQAKELGLNTSSYWLITVFEIPKYSDLQLLELETHQLISNIKKELQSSEKLIFGFHNKIILLISTSQPDHFNRIYQKFDSIRKEWESDDYPSFSGGISGIYKGLENIRKCYDEANKTLSYLANRKRTDIIQYGDIGLNRLFLNQPSEEIEEFINEVFSPLWSENDRNKDLEKTLLTFIEYNYSATKTAESLHIHVNTLYQRIKKIEDLLQLKLSKNEDILKIQLACHLRSTYHH